MEVALWGENYMEVALWGENYGGGTVGRELWRWHCGERHCGVRTMEVALWGENYGGGTVGRGTVGRKLQGFAESLQQDSSNQSEIVMIN